MEALGLTNSRKKEIAEAISQSTDCPGQILCKECFWALQNGGYCSGCDSGYQTRCLKRVCYHNCYYCSGGRHAYTPGCCGRTVLLRQSWLDRLKIILEYPLDDYLPDPLEINCRLIPVIYPEVKKHNIPEQYPQIDAWAVPIRRVANSKGRFYSNDLKDYIGLPPDRKLILDTCAPDDYQEVLWAQGPQMKYKEHGIDYWFPGHFSIYDDDSKLYQFFNAKRQQIHAIWTESQFVWFRIGENITLEFLNSIRNAPSILISPNQMYSKYNKEILVKEVKIADLWFPPETSFFIVGDYRWLHILPSRKCFSINTSWLVRALKGKDMREKLQLDNKNKLLDIGERLMNNLNEVMKNVC